MAHQLPELSELSQQEVFTDLTCLPVLWPCKEQSSGGNVWYLFAKSSVVGGDAGDATYDTSSDTPSNSTHNTRGYGHGGGTSSKFPSHGGQARNVFHSRRRI